MKTTNDKPLKPKTHKPAHRFDPTYYFSSLPINTQKLSNIHRHYQIFINTKRKKETVIFFFFFFQFYHQQFQTVWSKSQMSDVAAMERKILVAVDEDEESVHALSWCLKNVISKNSKDTLVLLYVKPPRAVFSALDGTGNFLHSPWAF